MPCMVHITTLDKAIVLHNINNAEITFTMEVMKKHFIKYILCDH